jgi:hypothetical protein
VAVTFYILPNGQNWRVLSRGFAWDFELAAQAMDFANDMAAQYARASNTAITVRWQDDGGEFHEMRVHAVDDAAARHRG